MHWLAESFAKQDLLEHRLSVATLVAANALPLLGVVFWGWSAFEIVLLYWFENVVLGLINVLKMLTCSPDPDQMNLEALAAGKPDATPLQIRATLGSRWAMQGAKLFFVPFFTVHYGVFCLGHGVFVFVLLGPGGLASGGMLHGGMGPDLEGLHLQPLMLLAATGLAISHLVSFFTNYLGRGEYRRTLLPMLMMQPYGRIVVLHVAIVLGAFAVVVLGSQAFLLGVLVVGKTLLDLKLHLREHKALDAGLLKEAVLTTVDESSA